METFLKSKLVMGGIVAIIFSLLSGWAGYNVKDVACDCEKQCQAVAEKIAEKVDDKN